MIVWIFLFVSLAAAAGFYRVGLLPWQAALSGLGAFVLLNLLFVVFWVIVASTVDDTKPIEKQKPIYRFGCASCARWILSWCGVRPHLSGEALLPQEGRFLLVCNHRSGFDPIVTYPALYKYNVSFISKPENLKLPFIGPLAYGAGFLPINRENDREALKSILLAANYMKQDFCSMCVYPEGTRSKQDTLLPFHAGSFKIAQRANAPLVIAAIRGSDQVKGHFLRRPKHVYLDILECIPAEKVKAASTQELAAHSRALISEHLGLPLEEETA